MKGCLFSFTENWFFSYSVGKAETWRTSGDLEGVGETSLRPRERESKASQPSSRQGGAPGRGAKGPGILVLPPLAKKGAALCQWAQRSPSAGLITWIACYLCSPREVSTRNTYQGAKVTHRPLKAES